MHRLLSCFVVGLLLSSTPRAEVIPITPEYPGGLQAAIALADSGDVIEMADGVYVGPGNHDIHLPGRAVTIRSASGNPAACRISGQGQAWGFLIDQGEGPDTRLEGIGIWDFGHDGYVDGPALAIYGSSSPTIVNCHFQNNAGYESGGAVYCERGNPSFIDCRFEGNEAAFGGAVRCRPMLTAVTFQGCDFIRNYAGDGGGGADGDGTFTDCTFIANGADGFGGGAAVTSGVFTRCTFICNGAIYGAGGLGCRDAEISYCTFSGNASYGEGGGLVCSNALVDHTIVWGNCAESGDQIWVDSPFGSPTLTCCDVDSSGIFGPVQWQGHNLFVDPLFCDPRDCPCTGFDGCYELQAGSPCASDPQCGQIGALGVGCPSGGGPSPAILSTWGEIKAVFRR